MITSIDAICYDMITTVPQRTYMIIIVPCKVLLDDGKVNPTHLYTGSISNISLPLCSSATCYTYQVSSIYLC